MRQRATGKDASISAELEFVTLQVHKVYRQG